MTYRLVELKYKNRSMWFIEEQDEKSWVSRWVRTEDEPNFSDYNEALLRLEAYRNENNDKPQRIILDV